MTAAAVIPRAVAYRNARAALDAARRRRDADEAAGQLSPEHAAHLARLRAAQATRLPTAA